MSNLWKYTAIGVVAVGLTAGTSSVMTAYIMRPAPPEAQAPEREPDVRSLDAPESSPVTPERHDMTTAGAPRTVSLARTSAGEVPRPVVSASPAPSAPGMTPDTGAARASSPSAGVPAGCASGVDRAMRIAKPGGIGALLGAALGAASGAMAGGGKGAGKGALIGAGVGAVAGGAYGAYETQKDCGTIVGESADLTSDR